MRIHRISDFKGEFFRILETTEKSQLGVMTIGPGKDSGPEELHDGDQVIYVIEGEADVEVGAEKATVRGGEAVIIPAGTRHRLFNNGEEELFFLTLYAPPSY